MTFEKWMSCEVVVSDGTYTIGHVDGKPAEWDGNSVELTENMEYREKPEGTTFDVNTQDEYIVEDGKWIGSTR